MSSGYRRLPCVGRPEVGTVPAEHVAPLLARILDGFGDEVRDAMHMTLDYEAGNARGV